MFLFQHAEADEAAEFPGEGALRGNFAGRFGLVEAWLVMTDYPEGQGQPARPPEELPAYLARIQRRVLSQIINYYLESR